MNARTGARRAIIASIGVALVATLTGCNGGQNTSCSVFRSKGVDKQKAIVEKMMKSRGEEVTPFRVGLTRLSVSGYCTVHTGDSKISGIYGG